MTRNSTSGKALVQDVISGKGGGLVSASFLSSKALPYHAVSLDCRTSWPSWDWKDVDCRGGGRASEAPAVHGRCPRVIYRLPFVSRIKFKDHPKCTECSVFHLSTGKADVTSVILARHRLGCCPSHRRSRCVLSIVISI